jgi:hypothetical protein
MSLKLGMNHCLPLEPIHEEMMKPKPTKRKRKQKEDEIENDIEAEFDNLKAELPVINNFITNEYVADYALTAVSRSDDALTHSVFFFGCCQGHQNDVHIQGLLYEQICYVSHHFHLKHHEISHLVRSPLAAYQCILSLQFFSRFWTLLKRLI